RIVPDRAINVTNRLTACVRVGYVGMRNVLGAKFDDQVGTGPLRRVPRRAAAHRRGAAARCAGGALDDRAQARRVDRAQGLSPARRGRAAGLRVPQSLHGLRLAADLTGAAAPGPRASVSIQTSRILSDFSLPTVGGRE